jgi:V8-like Glu-specific endopeptidase
MIIGGQVATLQDWPDVIALEGCTGAVIQPGVVLTSAHCVFNGSATKRDEAHIPCELHPKYHEGVAKHDIAICKDSTITAGTAGLPVDLRAAVQESTEVTLLGYGADGPFSHDRRPPLRELRTTIARGINESMQVGTETQTACLGDSGGPVLSHQNGRNVLIGIVHGTNGAICKSPAEVTLLADNREWLDPILAQTATTSGTPRSAALSVFGTLLFGVVLILARGSFRRFLPPKQTTRELTVEVPRRE